MEPKLILITLLIKLAVAAAWAGALIRSREFKNVLFAEERTIWQRIWLVLLIGLPLMGGVWVRVVVKNFQAADIAFEAAILIGIIGGRFSGAIGGALLSIPAVLHGEWLTLPFNVLIGVTAGWLRVWAPKEDIWSFSPFIDLSLYRWITRNLRQPRFDWQIFFLMMVCVLQFFRIELGRRHPGKLFFLDHSGNPWMFVSIYAFSVMVVALPLKIWNAVRIEMKLEDQEKLLLEARLQALQRQINPHFLFNTLNSIASLVRFRPEQARELIVKLANILRALLKDHDSYVQLRDELNFTDDYLGIEVVRFGADKLKVVKEIDPATLDLHVPSMILQPLIENSIKHGLEPRISGGTITIRSRLTHGKLVIEVEDDGVGITPGHSHSSGVLRQGTGIGMSNVRERLDVLFGDAATFDVTSRPGRGTHIVMEMPAAGYEDGETGSTPLPARSSMRS